MALGVDEHAQIKENKIKGWEKGIILFIYSDGIKELKNEEDKMYGEARITGMIKINADKPAKVIEGKIIEDLHDFRGQLPIQDDITLVNVKFS